MKTYSSFIEFEFLSRGVSLSKTYLKLYKIEAYLINKMPGMNSCVLAIKPNKKVTVYFIAQHNINCDLRYTIKNTLFKN